MLLLPRSMLSPPQTPGAASPNSSFTRQAPRALRAITRSLSNARAEPQFLHLAPSGDFWIGSAIYAAKHNPSDYVRSLPLPIGQTIPEDCPHEALVKMSMITRKWTPSNCGRPGRPATPPRQ